MSEKYLVIRSLLETGKIISKTKWIGEVTKNARGQIQTQNK